ncbi:hypothetical protein K7Z10_02540 [Bacillus licheniformis]|uniref:CD3337/EF1877 family mobilome membrane protein n=1 Tax=Bacillus licheniformis TaxID=1402 RepID=UPI000FFDF876|nr:hypothetical protein [Bacillus licheniformis]MBY8830425.1 hypothetical protein [Bacillus licheniformis]MED1082327.1 hypothetical protein [Bacillus licheniformis]QAT51905.1 hypothetical protein EQY74_03000 [Bacillus licheniformis]
MKRKRILIVSAVVLLFLTFATALSVFSADGDVTTQPKVEKAGGVELEIKRFPISRYQANNEDSDDWLKGPFIGFTNVLFSTAGNVVRVVDMGMEVLNNLQPIDAFADSITNVSKRVYTTLKDNFGEALFIFAVGYILYLFAVRGSAKEAMRRSILFLVVLIIGGWYMSNAGYVMKALNALSVEAQGKLLNAGNGLLGIAKDEGRFVEASNIEKGKEMEGTIAVMRNLYFDLALKKPYMIVNFGEANEKKINEKGSDDKGGMNRVDKLLSYKLSSDGEKARLEYIKSIEIDKYNNEALTSGNAYNQFGESIIGLFASIALGIPFLGLSFLNFLLQLIALVIVFFVPFAFVVAYIPQFAYSGFVSLGRLGSVYILKAMLGIVFLFVYVICFIIDTLLPPNNFGMYLLNVIVLFLTLFLGFKHRNKIVKFVTAGKVVSVDNNMMENMRRNVVQPSWESAKDVWNKTFGRNGHNKTSEDLKHSSDPSVSNNNATAFGTESLSVERTPQKDQNINLLDNKKALDRKPQHSMKSEQHNNLLKKQDNERGIAPGQNNGSDNDGLRKEEEQFKRAPVIRNTEIEAERTDQKDFVKRNRLNDSQNQYNSTVDIQQEQKDDNPRKAPVVQENRMETARVKQRERILTNPINERENIRTLNEENVNNDDVKIVRSNTPSSSVQTGNFFSGEKQNNPSNETRVNREAAVKKVAPKDSGFKRSDQTVALNDIASRTSSKTESRLRSDKRA